MEGGVREFARQSKPVKHRRGRQLSTSANGSWKTTHSISIKSNVSDHAAIAKAVEASKSKVDGRNADSTS